MDGEISFSVPTGNFGDILAGCARPAADGLPGRDQGISTENTPLESGSFTVKPLEVIMKDNTDEHVQEMGSEVGEIGDPVSGCG